MFKIVSKYVYSDIFEVIDSADCYQEALNLINIFDKENFEGGRHVARVNKLG